MCGWREREGEKENNIKFQMFFDYIEKNVFCYSVYSWGWGVYGQLGYGNIEDVLIFIKVIFLILLNVFYIQVGYCYFLVLIE